MRKFSSSFVLWGSAGHAKVLAEIIQISGGKVVAFFDNADVPSIIPGVPVFKGESGFKEWAKAQKDNIKLISGLVAIGGSRGRDRLYFQDLFIRYGLYSPNLIHPSSFVSNSASVNIGCQVLAFGCVAADVKLGISCIINHKASVDHECTLGNGVHIAPGATICGAVTLGDNVFVGAGATVLPNLHIGENSIIGAGSVVIRNVPPNSIIAGNPATNIIK